MTGQGKPFQVYSLAEGNTNVHGVVRYDGDPDVFAALAHDWLLREKIVDSYDYPIGLCPPEPSFWRWVHTPQGDFEKTLYPAVRSRGAWLGAELKVARIGCAKCQRLDWQPHAEACLNYGITALMTMQFQGDRTKTGLYGTPAIVHAVRSREGRPGLLAGTPGPTLCDLPRFDPAWSPAWSVGGGRAVDGMRGCWLCQKVARQQFPGLAIHGALPFAVVFAGDGIPLAAHLVDELVVKTSNLAGQPVRR